MPFQKGRSGNRVAQFKRGRSGNPAGRPLGLTRDIRETTGQGAELVNFMLAVFRGDALQIANGKARASQRNKIALRDRIAAATWLADRAFGRPGQILDDEIPEVPIGYDHTGSFEEPDYRAVLSGLPDYLQPLIAFLYLTGWRKGEALGLQWRQVDFGAGAIRLEPGTTKNDEGRMFPFRALPGLAELLQAQRERTQDLVSRTGRNIPWVFDREGHTIKEFRAKWKNACRAAGVPGRIIHDFRRTAVRNLERAGVPRSVAMKLTGHKTESIYRRYAIVSEADLSVGVAKLPTLHASQTVEFPIPSWPQRSPTNIRLVT